MARMTEQERNDFDELYQYVRSNIMGYDNSQSLPSSLVLRLRGLSKGKCLDNKNIKDMADYPFNVILASFILNKDKIDYVIRNMSFKSDISKFAYITKIVEGSLNDVYERIKYVDSVKNKFDQDVIENEKTCLEYKRKSVDIKNGKLKDMW